MFKISPKFFSIKFLSTVLCAMVISSHAHSEIYKWVNEKGETVYSEKKPQDPKTSVREIKPRVSESPAPETEESAEDAGSEEKQADAEPKVGERTYEDLEQKQKNAELRKENCKIAKSKFTRLQRPRINDVGPDGERRRIGEDERQAQIKDAVAAQKQWCS